MHKDEPVTKLTATEAFRRHNELKSIINFAVSITKQLYTNQNNK